MMRVKFRDEELFDTVSRLLARRVSRRATLNTLPLAAVATLVGANVLLPTRAQADPEPCCGGQAPLHIDCGCMVETSGGPQPSSFEVD